MKATEKAALQAAVYGAIAAGLAYWLLPGAMWWLPIVLGVGVMGVAYPKILKDMAEERSANDEVGAQGKN